MSRVTYQISMCRLFAHVRQFVRLFIKQFAKLSAQRCRGSLTKLACADSLLTSDSLSDCLLKQVHSNSLANCTVKLLDVEIVSNCLASCTVKLLDVEIVSNC